MSESNKSAFYEVQKDRGATFMEEGGWFWTMSFGDAAKEYDAIRGGVGALGHRVARGIALDITAHKQAQSRLQETLSLLGATLESTADGILVVDASGHVTHYNRRFAEIWGLADDVLRAGDQVLDHVAGQVMPRDEFLAELRTRDVDRDPTPVEVLELRDGRMFERS